MIIRSGVAGRNGSDRGRPTDHSIKPKVCPHGFAAGQGDPIFKVVGRKDGKPIIRPVGFRPDRADAACTH